MIIVLIFFVCNFAVHSLNFPAASLPTSAGGNGPNNSRLRRRLSDKDKERRLVRRSSSKRKDKENGVSGGSAAKISASSGSLDKGSSGALTAATATAAAVAASGTPVTETGAIHHAGDSGVGHDYDFLRLSTEHISRRGELLSPMNPRCFPTEIMHLSFPVQRCYK